MNLKIATCIFALCTITLHISAQSWQEVKNSGLYYYGEGWGTSIAEADKNALGDLISKIAIDVTEVTSNDINTQNINGNIDEISQFSSSVNTYSRATLTNTERIIIQNEPDAYVGRWIKRSEINKIFELRIHKAKEYVSEAVKAEETGKIDDALRNYYWALTLCKSLQHPNEVVYDGHMLMQWIPQRMNDIFRNLNATVVKRHGDDVELFITYKGKPVNTIDYTYFDGQGWSNIYSAKDGRGVLELASGNKSTNFQLKYEFEYRGQAHIDRELESVLNVVKNTQMRNAYINISAEVSASDASTTYKDNASFSKMDTSALSAPEYISGASEYTSAMDRVIKAIQNKNYEIVRPLFSNEGWEVYTKLITYGTAKIVGTPSFYFYQNGEYVVGRGVQMAFSFKTGIRKSFVEDVVFTFDKDKLITNLAFGLGKTAEDDILNKGAWSENARKAVMNFLENYKTAYGLKRLDYIRSVFDDQAVIIVGKVVKKATLTKNAESGVATISNNAIIQRNRYTKDQYLDNLARCFTSNEYINIRFANNDVIKMRKGGELYAIQITQDYYSSTYGDKGYLFLIVDINDPERPIIKVRTWQEEKDPNFGLYGPGDF